MSLLIATLIVVLFVYLLSLFADANTISLVISGVSLVLAITAANEFKSSFAAITQRLPKHVWLSAVVKSLRRITPIFVYIDFSIIIVSLVMLCVALFGMFVGDVDELVKRKLLTFGPSNGGYVYLQLTVGGYLYLPPLLIAAVGYGFYRGLHYARVSFGKMLIAVIVGIIGSALAASIYYGGFTGKSGLDAVNASMPESVPSGARMSSPAIVIGTMLGGIVIYVVIVWLSSVVGSVFRHMKERRALSLVGGRSDFDVGTHA